MRIPRGSLVAAFVLGVGLCFVPLFNLLGYESAAACGFGLGLIAIFSTSRALRRGDVQAPLAPERVTSPARDFATLLVRNELVQLVPLALLSLDMLRVQNCDPVGGLVFWLAIVPFAILVGQMLAWTASALVGPRFLALCLALIVVVLDLLSFGLDLALRPPITGHSLLFGYFAGSLYDEALSLPDSLLWYRAANTVVVGGVLALLERSFHRRAGRRTPTLVRWILALSFLSWAGLRLTQQDHGIRLDAHAVQEALGGRVETEHFVIYFSHQDVSDPEDVRRMAEDHEYRYWELSRFFDVDIDAWRGRKIESYVYPNAKRQHDLMGALDTFVARPWTHAMHIRWDGYGDSALAHEMAHLFSAAFGYGPFEVATRHGIPADIGLVEGIAVTADWAPTEMDPDVASAAMRKLDIAPKLENLFRPFGFWTQPNAKAYTLMASFVHFLVTTHGIETFEKVYGRGDFEAVYGKPITALIAEWRTYVDAIAVDDATLERARARYDKKSIFEKVCARTIAELDRQADGARNGGDLERSLELRQRILSFQPSRASHKIQIAKLLGELERRDDALAIVDALLASGTLKRGEEGDVRELRADLLYELGRTADAKTEYDTCDSRPLADGDRRRIDLKERGLFTDDETIRELAKRYLFDAKNRTAMLYYALRWSEEEPGDPLARYLVGFQLWQNHQEADALPWLVGPPGTLPTQALDDQRLLVLGYCLFRSQMLDDADAVFAGLLSEDHGSRVRMTALEWRQRVTWKRSLDAP